MRPQAGRTCEQSMLSSYPAGIVCLRAKHGWRSKYAFGQRIHAGRTCLFSGWAVFLCFALAGGGRQGENRTQRCGLRNEVWFSASTFRTLFLRSGRAQVTEIAEIVAIPSSAVTTSRAELAGISFFFLFGILPSSTGLAGAAALRTRPGSWA